MQLHALDPQIQILLFIFQQNISSHRLTFPGKLQANLKQASGEI